MKRRSRIVRMDRWDVPASKPKLKGGNVPLCDLSERPALHQIGDFVYFSHYRRTKNGTPFDEIKQSEEVAERFAESAYNLLRRLIPNTEGWAIITTPRRRHTDGFHFSTSVCRRISELTGIPFYNDAVQCINRSRLNPEFHLLRPLDERKVIIYDDIITTGSTLTATATLLYDREMIINLIGINNR